MARNINLDIPLEDIPQLDFDELYKLYIELFSLPTKATRKSFFIWRVTNRLQELRFGGLDSVTKHLLETMDDEPDNAKSIRIHTIKYKFTKHTDTKAKKDWDGSRPFQ